MRDFIKEHIRGDKDKNIVSDIHNMAVDINKSIMKDMDLMDDAFEIIYTPYGLWIEWDACDWYGIGVLADMAHSIIIRSEDDGGGIVSETVIPLPNNANRVAKEIIAIALKDGLIN